MSLAKQLADIFKMNFDEALVRQQAPDTADGVGQELTR